MPHSTYFPSYSYPVANYPPWLYSHQPSDLESISNSDFEDFIDEPGMFGGATSGYLLAPVAGPSGIHLSPEPISNGPPSKPSHEETEAYLRQNIGIPPPFPVNLWAIPDARTLTISQMIKLAIWGSPEKRLTIGQIYNAIEQRYPEKREYKDKAWQRSIRHDLSLKDIFVKEPRPKGHHGRGQYWLLDIRNQGRRRKRGGHKNQGHSQDRGFGEESSSSAPSWTPLPQHGWNISGIIKTESPQPDMLLVPTHESVMSDRLGHLNLGGLSIQHGYQQPVVNPPSCSNNAINPGMTMGDYPSDDTMVIGPSFPPLENRGDRPLAMIPEVSLMVMGMQHGPPQQNVRMPSHRRTYDYSFGLEDEEGDSRGAPKARCSTE